MSSNPSAQLNAPGAPSDGRALLGCRRVRTVAIVCALFTLLFFVWPAPLLAGADAAAQALLRLP